MHMNTIHRTWTGSVVIIAGVVDLIFAQPRKPRVEFLTKTTFPPPFTLYQSKDDQ